MIAVLYAERALLDIERLTSFLLETDRAVALVTANMLFESIHILTHSPEIGRPVTRQLQKLLYQELIVSRGRTGYVVLYQYMAAQSQVLIVNIRHQREAGYV